MKLLITGGGSAGHLYPALAVANRLRTAWTSLHDHADPSIPSDDVALAPPGRRTDCALEVLYLGSSRGLEQRLAPREGLPAILFPMSSPSSPAGIGLLLIATLRAFALVARLRPTATFATGGYVSVPGAIASWLLRVPLLVFLPDAVPGKAVSLLLPLARRVGVTCDDALSSVPRQKATVTGYPVREAFRTASRTGGRVRFGIDPKARVLCVFGGSQGARAINEAVGANLPALLELCSIIHVCGEQRFAEAQAAVTGLTAEQRSRYLLFPFLQEAEMADALAAADLAVCRSGASTLGELPATGTPAILVPLPNPGVHQAENAEYMTRNGAAVTVSNADLGMQLLDGVTSLMRDRTRLAEMAAACRALDRPDAADRLAELLIEVAS